VLQLSGTQRIVTRREALAEVGGAIGDGRGISGG
jgi:hypothetical protein